MKLKTSLKLLYGIATFIPGISSLRLKGASETASSRYCYSVWLRHLVMAHCNGLNSFPKVVAEFGPGKSLGIGLAALISGCEQYFALDVVEHANVDRNVRVFDELVDLFKNCTDIPGDNEFSKINPQLKEYSFPHDILDGYRLKYALEDSRLENIRNSIINPHRKDSVLKYSVPWYNFNVIKKESIDMIYSQAVLEHIDNLENAYKAMNLGLKPTGYISHQIDFKCHGTADEWNGHWTYSDLTWKLMRGKRPYLLNRQPYSLHLSLLEKEGFKLITNISYRLESKLQKKQLAPQFQSMSDDDLITSGAFVQGMKVNNSGGEKKM